MDGNKNFFLHVWWNNKVSVNRIWYFAILMWDYSELLPSMFQLCKRCPDAQPAEQPACWGEILDTLSWLSWWYISPYWNSWHIIFMRWDISLLQSQTLLFKVGFLSSHHHTHHQSDLSDHHLDHHQAVGHQAPFTSLCDHFWHQFCKRKREYTIAFVFHLQTLQLDTLLLEPILARSLRPRGFESREAKFYLSGNPW